MKKLFILLTAWSLIFAGTATAQECTTIDMESTPDTGRLQDAISDFFEAEGFSPDAIPEHLSLETAVKVVNHLQQEGFSEVSIQIQEGESHWWKYPGLVGIGITSGMAIFFGIMTLLDPPWKWSRRVFGPSIPAVFRTLVAGVAAMSAVPLVVATTTDFGEEPFACELLVIPIIE